MPLDVHLMITHPDRYLEHFRNAGADHITVHAEACTHLDRTIQAIKTRLRKAGGSFQPTHTRTRLRLCTRRTRYRVDYECESCTFGGQSLITRCFFCN